LFTLSEVSELFLFYNPFGSEELKPHTFGKDMGDLSRSGDKLNQKTSRFSQKQLYQIIQAGA